MSTTDRYGLPLSTSSAVAAEHYQAGMDRLLAYGYGADQSFAAAVPADGEFALAHAGAALVAPLQGHGESRRRSEPSLAQHPANANASHNIAHICYETVDNEGGIAMLTDWLADYDRRAPFYCHLAWHLALFELQCGRPARAFAIHER